MPIDSSTAPRRILIITARADHGGGPRHILDLLTAFDAPTDRGQFEFYMAAPEQDPYASRFKAKCRSFFEIPARSFSILAFIRLCAFIRENKIDIIHSHGRGAGLYARLLALFTDAAVVHTFHGVHREPSLIGSVKLWLDRLLAYTRFTPIFVSTSERAEAIQFGLIRNSADGPVIENAVDLRRFKNARPFPAFENGRSLQIGTMLRPDAAKGPDRFTALIETAIEGVTWSCVGITPEELAPWIASATSVQDLHLNFAGRLPDPATWLQSLDVFVSTSRTEGLPLGVLEAMAAGAICVLSDIPAHRIFSAAGAALLFDPARPVTFIERLDMLRDDSSLRKALQNQAALLIRDRHSLQNFRDKIAPIYLGA